MTDWNGIIDDLEAQLWRKEALTDTELSYLLDEQNCMKHNHPDDKKRTNESADKLYVHALIDHILYFRSESPQHHNPKTLLRAAANYTDAGAYDQARVLYDEAENLGIDSFIINTCKDWLGEHEQLAIKHARAQATA